MRVCTWVKFGWRENPDNPDGPKLAPIYCGRGTKYRMEEVGREPGAAKVWTYDNLCPQHRLVYDERANEESEDEDLDDLFTPGGITEHG